MVPSYFGFTREPHQPPGSRRGRDLNFLWPWPNSHESSVSFFRLFSYVYDLFVIIVADSRLLCAPFTVVTIFLRFPIVESSIAHCYSFPIVPNTHLEPR
jgi:hypothetical protein